MLSEKEFFRPEYLIEITVRRKWYLIIPLAIAMIIGIYLSITLPKVYRASTLILVQPQKVPANYVRSIVTSSVEARLRTISEQIMSITNVERIIRNFNLFSEPQYKDMYWEDKINRVRERISLQVSKGHTFTVAFTGKTPKTVMEVANALASYFIDENLKVREAQAISTSAFLEDELIGVKSSLNITEKKLMEYRKKNMGSLPEQLDSNHRMLAQLTLELNEDENRLMALQENILRLESQRKEYLESKSNADIPISIPVGEENEDEDIAMLRSQYSALKARYTDKHPDMLKLKKAIENLENRKSTGEAKTEQFGDDLSLDNIPAMMDAEIKQGAKQVVDLKERIKEIKRQIPEYNRRIEKTPHTEQGLVEINRNYNNVQGQYNSLLSRKLESEIAVNMEKKQKGEQFKIVDPAKMPEKPYEPNLNALFFLFIAAGSGLGVALIVLMEYFDTAFRRAEEIEPFLALPVLAYVPKIKTKEELRRQKIRNAISIIPIAGTALLFGIFTISTIKADESTIVLLEKLGIIQVVDMINELLVFI